MRRGTYSIVAHDPVSGAHGAAVQSHWFGVGALCAWARPDVGAVATQSIVEPAYGPRGLDRMAAGQPSQQALAELLAADALAAFRQVAMVDADGRAATHTGPDCIAHAGHVVGERFSCQANMMASEGVPEAMAEAFAAAEGDLAARLLSALEAAERAGGDVRGRQSAAMVVAPAGDQPWWHAVDLRVEDHSDPVTELARLLRLQRAYTLASEADELLGAGRADAAGQLYVRAAELAPESDELLFWAGLALAATDVEEGTATVRRAAAINPAWLTLLDRLAPELAPAAEHVRRALGR